MASSPSSPGEATQRPLGRRRAAAVIALIAAAATIALAGIALAGDVAIALLAVALAAAACGAAWFALTRHGARRAAGGVVAALAVVGLVVTLATHWQGLIVLLGLAALLTVFGAAARYAVAGPLAGGTATAIPVSRHRAAVLIINLRSGGGKAERFGLAIEARRRGIEPIVLRPGDDLVQLAESAIARGADVVGMAGGDGSQALVATVAARRDVPYVCVPAGTRNHFALDLGLDRADVVGALDAYTDGIERTIDLARVNDRVFVNNASLGAYAEVVQSDAYRDAKLETWTTMLPELLGPKAEPIDLRFTTPEGRACDDAPLVLVSNNPYQLTHMAGAGSRERLDSGTLGVVAARIRNPRDISTLVALELVGQAGRFRGLMSWSCDEFEVRSRRPVAVGLDGEALVLQPPLRFVSLPEALRVRLPPGTGGAPAARAVALKGESLKALVDVLGDG